MGDLPDGNTVRLVVTGVEEPAGRRYSVVGVRDCRRTPLVDDALDG